MPDVSIEMAEKGHEEESKESEESSKHSEESKDSEDSEDEEEMHEEKPLRLHQPAPFAMPRINLGNINTSGSYHEILTAMNLQLTAFRTTSPARSPSTPSTSSSSSSTSADVRLPGPQRCRLSPNQQFPLMSWRPPAFRPLSTSNPEAAPDSTSCSSPSPSLLSLSQKPKHTRRRSWGFNPLSLLSAKPKE